MREQAHNLEVRDLRKNFDEVNRAQIIEARMKEIEAKRRIKEEEERRLQEVKNSILLEEDMRKEKLK